MFKNFIPENIREKKNIKNLNSIKRATFLLFITNLIMIPITFDKLINNKEDGLSQEIAIVNVEENLLEDMYKYIDILERFTVEGNLINNRGEVILKNNNMIEKLEKKVNITLLSNKDGKYFLEIGEREYD